MASTEVAQRTPLQELVARIRGDEFLQQVQMALPDNVRPERFQRVAVTAVMQNPDLLKAEPISIIQALIRCAQDGLVPDGREAALTVFGGKAQYMSMIGGIRKIAANHGFALEAYLVHQNDRFEYELGFEPFVLHRPPPLGEERGEIVGAYSVAVDRETGGKQLEVMSAADIEAVRQFSRQKDGAAWTKSWGEMARKTVARRGFKQLPLTDLDEREANVIRQADADVEFEETLTADEANIVAGLANVGPPHDSGPDDAAAASPPPEAAAAEPEDGEWQDAAEPIEGAEFVPIVVDAGSVVVPGGIHKGKTLFDVGQTPEGQQWLLTQLRRLEPGDSMREAIEAFVYSDLPLIWERYQS